MSNSISKYYDQQEDLQISNRRAKIHKELKALIKEVGIVGDPNLSNLGTCGPCKTCGAYGRLG